MATYHMILGDVQLEVHLAFAGTNDSELNYFVSK